MRLDALVPVTEATPPRPVLLRPHRCNASQVSGGLGNYPPWKYMNDGSREMPTVPASLAYTVPV